MTGWQSYTCSTHQGICVVLHSLSSLTTTERIELGKKNKHIGHRKKKARRQRETGKARARLDILLCKSRQSRSQLLLVASESLLCTRRALLVQRLRLEKLLVDDIAPALFAEILP